ncbi:SAC3/GANP/Nin1/mts3/eIF-3 p25 family-domain-containing protein [Gongronella butleri]|nr:SAC3/GANP/Nin1/mts3/eIF-3 p25 family-domain-containing protein [Gongronella butleri]
MKQQRVEERRQAIEQKLMPDPDAPTSLAEAIDFRGTCTSMCPEFEMVERELQNGLDVLETNDDGQVDPNKAVKRYRRSAAGIEQPLPSDVRPPDVLLMTLDYLMNEILPNHALERCHAFIRDRTRSIRQDFTLQNIRDVSAVEIHERVARFHILSLHELSGLDEERFSIQQEMEQLRKVLLSLTEFYDDLRQEEKVEMPNEPEFRAYYLLCHPRDPDVARQMQSLPPHVFRHPMLERARKFRGMMQRNNEIKETPSRRNKPANVQGSQNMYAPFFKLVAAQDTPFLMACLLETHFPDIRKGALKAMNVAYHSPNDVTVADVAALLQYDSQDDLITEARLYGLQVTFNGQSPVIQFHKKHPRTKQVFFVEPLSNPKPRRSNLVESKKGGLSLQAIVDEPPPDMAPMVSPAMPSPAVSIASRLSAHAAPFVPPSQMLPAAGASVQAPVDDDDQDMENIDAWQAHVEGARELQKLESEIEAFRRKIAQKEQLKQQQQQIQQQQPAPQPLASTTSSLTSLFGAPTTTTPPALPMAAAPRAQEAADDATKRDQELARLRGEAMANRARLKAQRHAEWMAHVCARALDTLARDVLRETTANVVHDVARQYAVLRRLTKPWVDRARAAVAQRHANEDAKRHHARFTNAIYSDDAIFVPIGPQPLDNNACKERAAEAIYTHKLAIANKKEDNVPANEIWDFAPYSDIMHMYAASKLARLRSNNARGCQLWINVANHNDMSTRWFRVKFGLHGDTHLRTTVYKDCRITLRALTNTDNMHGRDVDDLGAVIFSLKDNPSTQWASEKTRLHQFFQSLTHRNPHLRVPLLITYWPSKQWEHDVAELHARLDLPSLGAVADFKILVMDPHTINEQMHKSIEWLAMHIEMNQPSLAVHDARAQFRAAVGEIERSTFFVPASTPPHQAAAMANARIDAFNAFLREMPVNWAPFVLPHLAVSHPFNLANASIKWLTEASQKRIISEQTPTQDLSDMLACAITQSINEMDRRLRALYIQ